LADQAQDLMAVAGFRVGGAVIRSRACGLRVYEVQGRDRCMDVSLDDESLEDDRKQCGER